MIFIREFFDRILVFIVFLLTVGIYWFKASPFSEQLVVTVCGGLLGMLIGRRLPQAAETKTNVEKAEVQEINLNGGTNPPLKIEEK